MDLVRNFLKDDILNAFSIPKNVCFLKPQFINTIDIVKNWSWLKKSDYLLCL